MDSKKVYVVVREMTEDRVIIGVTFDREAAKNVEKEYFDISIEEMDIGKIDTSYLQKMTHLDRCAIENKVFRVTIRLYGYDIQHFAYGIEHHEIVSTLRIDDFENPERYNLESIKKFYPINDAHYGNTYDVNKKQNPWHSSSGHEVEALFIGERETWNNMVLDVVKEVKAYYKRRKAEPLETFYG